jgi:hypothetical protein
MFPPLPHAREQWRVDQGGHWSWERDGILARSAGTEWVSLVSDSWTGAFLGDLRHVVIDVTVSGRAEAAGVSFGHFKDFLTALDSTTRRRRLQLEIDLDTGCWAFRVDGQLQSRQWWDTAVIGRSDFLSGALALKAKSALKVRFQDLQVRRVETSCRLSVVMTCYRFVQRLRVSLRNWCCQDLPPGAYELLVVNPESPDGTHEHLAAVMRSHPHVRVREIAVPADLARNKGAMINRALAESVGEWIWLTDADCLFAPDCAATVLATIDGRDAHLSYGQRRYLTSAQTDGLLSGRVDGVRQFHELASGADRRLPENAPWGYTQIVSRKTIERVRYREDLNHFAHSDGIFVQDCSRYAVTPRQLDGLVCLHLDHPFSWHGTGAFL